MNPRTLDAGYRARAIPIGSARHLSWLFAADAAQAPLLGIYALQSEWNALMDPRTERTAAQIKLAWWQEEMRRLVGAVAVHPVSLYLAALPNAKADSFAPLITAIDAAALEVSGVPLERSSDLTPHAHRLRASPLIVAAALSHPEADVHACADELAVGDYLTRAIQEYRQDARAGRVVFAVDELMDAGIDNAALAADQVGAALSAYLAKLRERAKTHYARAGDSLAPRDRSSQRHLQVLAALGVAQGARSPPRGLRALYLAWTTARHAATSREMT